MERILSNEKQFTLWVLNGLLAGTGTRTYTHTVSDVMLIKNHSLEREYFLPGMDEGSATRPADLYYQANFSVSERLALTNAQKREKLDHTTLY